MLCWIIVLMCVVLSHDVELEHPDVAPIVCDVENEWQFNSNVRAKATPGRPSWDRYCTLSSPSRQIIDRPKRKPILTNFRNYQDTPDRTLEIA